MYPGGVSQGHNGGLEEGNDNGDDAVVDAVADITDIVEAALVEEGVYDAYPIHLTHVPISSVQQDDEEDRDQRQKNVFKKNKSLSWGLLACAGIVAIAAGVGAYLGIKDMRTTRQDLPGSQDTEAANKTPESNTTFDPQANNTNTSTSPRIWEQVGSDIVGTAVRNRGGFSVASSNNGKIIAMGSPHNNDVAPQAGHVRIFAWDNTANDWTQRGSDLLGEAEIDRFGWSVALSGSGGTVVCGAPLHDTDDSGHVKVFKWDETLSDYVVWGSLHEGPSYEDAQWGWDVDVSDDGLTVASSAVGSMTDSKTFATVWRWNFTIEDWSPMGLNIEDDQVGAYFGNSIALSSEGTTLAIGSLGANSTSGEANVGETRVLKWDGFSEWVQVGSRIYGEAAGDESGWSIDLSADGKTLAISAIENHGLNGVASGHVRVYWWDDIISDWAQMGPDIDGKEESDRFGQAVSFTDDGRTIAITSTLNKDNGVKAGHCKVFKWSDSSQDWIQVGQDIQGEADDRIKAVDISSDGTTLIVGSWGASVQTGHVRVYNNSQWDGGEHDLFNLRKVL